MRRSTYLKGSQSVTPISFARRFSRFAHVGRNRAIVTVTGVLFVLPVIIDLAVNGWDQVFEYFAADAFYYLVVAHNFADLGKFTYDQTFTTNGFHPLWQIILGLVFFLLTPISNSDTVIMVIILFGSLLMVTAALVIISRVFILLYQQLPPIFILLPIGMFSPIVITVRPGLGTLWSYSNGMESALLILLFAVTFSRMAKAGIPNDTRSALIIGSLLAGVVLARLDSILLVIAWAIAVAVTWIMRPDNRDRIMPSIIVLVTVGITVGAYLVFNLITVGSAIPVSASLKSTFPYPLAGVHDSVRIALALASDSFVLSDGLLWRYAQLFIPPLFAGLGLAFYLHIQSIRAPRPIDFAMGVTGLFVILLGLYNFLFVPIWSEGSWYYPISTLYMSLLALYRWSALVTLFKRSLNKKLIVPNRLISKNLLRFCGAIAAILAAGAVVGYFLMFQRSDSNQGYAQVYALRDEIHAHYKELNVAPQILEWDDGIIGYTTGFPTLSGLGFALDPASLRAKQQGTLFQHAFDRGYRYFASFNYFDNSSLSLESDPEEVKELLSQMNVLGSEDLDQFEFHVDFVSTANLLVILSISER